MCAVRNSKADLLASELRHFHRPRLSPQLFSRDWKCAYYCSSNAGMLESVRDSLRVGLLAESSCPSSAQDKNDITLLTGDFVLVEYIEEVPPISLATGERVGYSVHGVGYRVCMS